MKRITSSSWKVVTSMKECPVCKNRYDTVESVCRREGSQLTDILVTTYPNPETSDRQDLLAVLQKDLKTAALTNDLKKLRECCVQIGLYHKNQGQLDQALAYLHRAELLEPGDISNTQLPDIVEIYIRQSRTDRAGELLRRIASLYNSEGRRDLAAEYFKNLITLCPTDLKWVRGILKIIEESGLASDGAAAQLKENPLEQIRSEFSVALIEENVPSLLDIQLDLEPLKTDEPFALRSRENEAGKNSPPITASTLPRITSSAMFKVSPEDLKAQAERSQNGNPQNFEMKESTPADRNLIRNSANSRFAAEQMKSGTLRVTGDFRSSGSYRPASDTAKFGFSNQTAMVVDDDHGVRDLLSEMLIELGCAVVTAVDGKDAKEKLEYIHPNFIIADVAMPRCNGYELFEYIQNNERLNDVLFIFLTGHGVMDDKLKVLNEGAEDYWVKPFDAAELSVRLRRVLQKVRLAGDVRGRLSEMPLPDLLQSLASGNKSGLLYLSRSGRSGVVYIDQGRMIDAEFENLSGSSAIYCLINWCMEGGAFKFRSQNIDRKVAVKQSIQEILMEAMRRRDEESKLLEQLPPGDVFMAVNAEENPDFFSSDFSDETKRIIQLFDGTHPLRECLRCLQGDLETIQTVVALNKAGLLRIVDFGVQ